MTAPRTAEVPLWNIANILTMVRCVMVPLLVVLAALYVDSMFGRLLSPACHPRDDHGLRGRPPGPSRNLSPTSARSWIPSRTRR